MGYGYATAVRLPIAVASKIDEYPEGTLIVLFTDDNQKSAAFGYANAVPLPYSPNVNSRNYGCTFSGNSVRF